MYLYYLLSFKMNEAKEEVNVFESNDKIVKESMLKFYCKHLYPGVRWRCGV